MLRFSDDLAWWPSFWPQVIQFLTWPRNHQDKHFKHDSWRLLKNVTARELTRFSFDWTRWPSSCFWPHATQFWIEPRDYQDKNSEQDSWWLLKNVTARVLTRFSADLARWPSFWSQLTQFRTWPRHQDILSKIHGDCLKNGTSRVLTIFSFDLTWWPSFWPQVTQFQTWPRFHRGKDSEQVLSRLTSRVLTN